MLGIYLHHIDVSLTESARAAAYCVSNTNDLKKTLQCMTGASGNRHYQTNAVYKACVMDAQPEVLAHSRCLHWALPARRSSA